MGLSRYLSIYAALWKNSVVREMSFKTNFLLWIVVELLWFALQLGFMAVIYQHTDSIAGWTKWEVVLLIGVSHFIQQLYTALFLTNVTQLSEYIRTGKLDFMLLLPINTRFLVSFRQVDLGGFVNAASAVGVMAYAAHRLALTITAVQVIGFLLLTVCSILVHYSLMLMLAATSFWTVRGQGVVWGTTTCSTLRGCPMPRSTAFSRCSSPTPCRCCWWPMSPPSCWPINWPRPREYVCCCWGLSLVCFGVSEWVWRQCLRGGTRRPVHNKIVAFDGWIVALSRRDSPGPDAHQRCR